VVASSAGAILDQSDFYPFGGERVLSASSGNTYKFTSKERDSESNLDNFGARYDSSILGRFMSPDPKAISAKLLQNPQDLNGYTYTINNPLRYSDHDGKDWQQAWNDVKTFVSSIEVKLSGGVGFKVGVRIGSFKAEAGVAAKANATVPLGLAEPIVKNSVSAELGVTVQPASGPKVGESVTAEKVTGSIKADGTVGDPEPAVLTKTDTLSAFGGNSATNASSDGRVGLGLEVGDVALLGLDVSASQGGVAAFKDFFSQVHDEVVPPIPPAPPPPPAPEHVVP
jgi:RHS repeat-associated protein